MARRLRALRFPKILYDQMVQHCLRDPKKEACGILAGSAAKVVPQDELWRVMQVYEMQNVENSPIGYSMDPKEQLAVERDMRTKHQKMLGIYHSYTARDAIPSPVDITLAISPDVSYVLVSLKDLNHPRVESYRIDGGRVDKEDVWIEESPAVSRQVGRG